MCTVVILRRPGQDWPVLLAANRDEMAGRPWKPPARHWPDREDVVAGLDETAGGSWLGINDDGVLAAIMNRQGALGPASGKRSRGELVLEALDHPDAAEAAHALISLDGDAYRPFNLIVADNRDTFWVRHTGDARVRLEPVPEKVSMIASRDLNDETHARIATYLPLFRDAPPPQPETGDWETWESLMSQTDTHGAGRHAAIAIEPQDGYGTLSSSLIALPAPGVAAKPVMRFCAGRPGTAPYQDIVL